MDKAIFIDNQNAPFQLGKKLLEGLDKRDVPVRAAFWYLLPDEKSWRLILASSLANGGKKKELYDAIWGILNEDISKDEFADFFSDIYVTGDDDELVKLLGSAIHTGPKDISGIRFKSNVINSHYIDDAYIYRLA